MGSKYRVPNIVSALFEFQKAQCFFMMAVQIAALIVVRGGRFEAKNLQQLSNSYSAITLVSLCGYLPIVFTLLNLHSAGKCSWYILALSTLTVAVSGATAFATRRFNLSPTDLTYLQGISGSWASCGNKNPATFCLSPETIDPFNYPGGVKDIFIFCVIILGFVFLDKCRHYHKSRRVLGLLRSGFIAPKNKAPRPGRQVVARLSTFTKYARKLSSSLGMTTEEIISNLVYGCVWALFVVFYCKAVYLLSTWINHQSGVIGPTNWTFGQIVGITVWAPSLIQYLYLETRKSIDARLYLNEVLTVAKEAWWLGSNSMLLVII